MRIFCFCIDCEKYKKCKSKKWNQFKPEIKCITKPIIKNDYLDKEYLSIHEIHEMEKDIFYYFNNSKYENIILPDLDNMSGIDMYAILLPFSYKNKIIFLHCKNFKEDY